MRISERIQNWSYSYPRLSISPIRSVMKYTLNEYENFQSPSSLFDRAYADDYRFLSRTTFWMYTSAPNSVLSVERYIVKLYIARDVIFYTSNYLLLSPPVFTKGTQEYNGTLNRHATSKNPTINGPARGD